MTEDDALETRDTPVPLNQRQRVPPGANRGQRSLAQGKDNPAVAGLFPKPSGYLVGAGIMVAGGVIEIVFGINGEGKSLDTVTKPLTSVVAADDEATSLAGPARRHRLSSGPAMSTTANFIPPRGAPRLCAPCSSRATSITPASRGEAALEGSSSAPPPHRHSENGRRCADHPHRVTADRDG